MSIDLLNFNFVLFRRPNQYFTDSEMINRIDTQITNKKSYRHHKPNNKRFAKSVQYKINFLGFHTNKTLMFYF